MTGPPASRFGRRVAGFLRRTWRPVRAWVAHHHWLVTFLVVVAVVLSTLDWLIDEPMRRWLEGEANRRLEGYSIRIPHADFRPWILSGRLIDVEIVQDAHPRPPVARLGVAAFDIDWQALFTGRLVADATVVRSLLHINTAQLRDEWSDRIPLKDRGWQRLWELYPLKVNRLAIIDGSVDYIDTASQRSLRLDRLNLTATNIRHVTSRGVAYPSPVEAEAILFRKGRLTLAGHANFLLRPHAGFNVAASVAGVPLAALGTVVEDYHVKLADGILAARGQFEVAPERYIANMQNLDIDDLNVDYVSGAETPAIARVRRRVAEAARYADQSPAVRLRAQRLNLTGTFGYVSATTPSYRVFLDRAKLQLTNFSNRSAQGESQLALDGYFMGSGPTRVRGALRPGRGPTDFALNAQVIRADLRALNDLLRAHGKFDVSAGNVSVYSQLQVKDGHVRGYVKPLFRDLEVYEPEDDEDKNAFRKLYEMIVEQLSEILENEPREEVATIVDLSGPLQDPNMSTLQVIGNLLRNAFAEAILPGFDAERVRADKEKRKPRAEAGPP